MVAFVCKEGRTLVLFTFNKAHSLHTCVHAISVCAVNISVCSLEVGKRGDRDREGGGMGKGGWRVIYI